MDTILAFVTIMAWIFGVISLGFVVRRIYANYSYTDMAKIYDTAMGIKRTFPVKVPGFVFIICLAWILST